MKHFILFLTLKLCIMISYAQNTKVADQIRKLEKAETVAFLNDDYAALNKIWHPQFTVNTPLNRILKIADIQKAMKAGLIKYSLLERNIEEIMIHGDVVISLGNEVTIPNDQAPMAGQKVTRRYINIWVKKIMNGECIQRHASNICDAEKKNNSDQIDFPNTRSLKKEILISLLRLSASGKRLQKFYLIYLRMILIIYFKKFI